LMLMAAGASFWFGVGWLLAGLSIWALAVGALTVGALTIWAQISRSRSAVIATMMWTVGSVG
jgi:hypothetical protein